MPELGSYGSVRGARGNSRPYRGHFLSRAVMAKPFPPLHEMIRSGTFEKAFCTICRCDWWVSGPGIAVQVPRILFRQ